MRSSKAEEEELILTKSAFITGENNVVDVILIEWHHLTHFSVRPVFQLTH